MFKKTGNVLDITVPDQMFRVDGLPAIKHLVQTDIFKFVPTLGKINFIETYEKKQTKSQQTTSRSSKPESKETKKTKAP